MRFAVVAALIAGCAPSAYVEIRELPVPAAFPAGAQGPSVASIDWRAYFADPGLEALIAEALAGNLDLRIAVQRIELARAGVRAATGELLPRVELAAGAGLTRYGRYTMDGAGNATTEYLPGRLVPNPLADLGVGLQAAWEPDLWGRLRGLRGAAHAQLLASVEGTNLVITNLVADVAIAYLELVALDHVRDALRTTIARQTEGLAMIRAQKEAGRTNELAVRQFDAQLVASEAMAADTERQVREAENRLNVLLGRFPGPVARGKGLLLRDAPATLAIGVPSELLRNRPDIREAELLVRASRFDVAAARAAFYPRITITAGAGYAAFDPRFVFATPDSIMASVAGGLLAPLVNRRGIEAAFAAAKASQLQAMYRYQSVVLTSFAEVSSGLAALERGAEIVAQRARRQQIIAGTVEAADALFRAGKATYLEVLLAQQNTLEAELELIAARRDQHVARVRLYRALGGGWR